MKRIKHVNFYLLIWSWSLNICNIDICNFFLTTNNINLLVCAVDQELSRNKSK